MKISPSPFSWVYQDTVRSLILFGAFLLTFLFFHFHLLDRFELVTYDGRCLLEGSRPTDSKIVVIEISDDSVKGIGRWPWDRDWHAALIKILKEVGAKAVVFDVLFSERANPQKDALMAKAIADSGSVYLAQIIEGVDANRQPKLLTSLPQFTRASRGGGHINLKPDIDGVMRRIPLLARFDATHIPQLSFKVALDEWGIPLERVVFKNQRLLIPQKEGNFLNIPLDEHGNFIIHWAGTWKNTFAHFSYLDVVGSYAMQRRGQKPKIPLSFFKDKICFVGTTAAGLFDIRPTPLEPSYPAVGVNLTVLNNLLEKRFIKAFTDSQNLWILLALLPLLFFVLKSSDFFQNALSMTLLSLLYVLFSLVLFNFFGIWIYLIYPLLFIVLSYFFVTLYHQLSAAVEKTRLYKLATRDSLTGLYNVGHFKLLLKAEMQTEGRKFSLVMADIDNFKKINDSYGHLVGDEVLREVANIVRANSRSLDVAARYGGEEMVLLLPGAVAEEAFKIAEKIRKALAEKQFTNSKGNFGVTLSMGVAEYRPSDSTLEIFIARADAALYEAKQSGKNRVVAAV